MAVPAGGRLISGRFGPGRPADASAQPFKVYLPRTRHEVVAAVREARALGQRLTVRGPGDREEDGAAPSGVVLSLARLDRILALDRARCTVTVEPGVLVSDLEEQLSSYGLGLRVSCHERQRSVGSFAALGGVGPSSHRYGLFLDSVRELEQVAVDGSARTFKLDEDDPGALGRALRGGRGVTTKLTLELAALDKRHTLLARNVRTFRRVDEFLACSIDHMRAEQGALLKFSRFFQLPVAGEIFSLGTVVSCYELERGLLHTARAALDQGRTALLRTLRHLPARGQELASALLLAGPACASVARMERTLSQPSLGPFATRVYRAIVRQDRCESLLWALYHRASSHRLQSGLIRSLILDITAVRSAYLSLEDGHDHCELRLQLGVPADADQRGLATFVDDLDRACATHGAARLLLPTPLARDERCS